MLLAIDTSTETASLALFDEGEVIAELTWRSGKNHTVELLPNLVHLLCQAGASPPSISGIIVAKGPGSFNGLRVGVSTAKGLVYTLGIPLVGISSLEVEAFPYAHSGLPLCPIHNAGRGEIAAAMYQSRRGKWRQLLQEHITTIDALCPQLPPKTLLCGEISPPIASLLRERLGPRAIIPQDTTRLRRASFLAELGWQRLKAGDLDDPATFQPLYLRRPQITLKRKQS
jgi:tRNA threonylcarbamoyladenosine biosynthesis protein TsaB